MVVSAVVTTISIVATENTKLKLPVTDPTKSSTFITIADVPVAVPGATVPLS